MVRCVNNTIAVTHGPNKLAQINQDQVSEPWFVASVLTHRLPKNDSTLSKFPVLLSSHGGFFTGDTIPGVMNHFCRRHR